MPINPLVGAALISAGSGFISNIFGKKSNDDALKQNLQINQMNNEFNERMLDKQLAYNTEMWNKQNEYNDPSAQVQRLKNAGINPYLAMQGNSSGQASSALGVNTPTASSTSIAQPFRPDTSALQLAAEMIYNKSIQQENLKNLKEDTTSKEIANRTAFQEAQARIMNEIENARSTRQRRMLESDLHELNKRQMTADFEKTMEEKREINLRSQGIYLENYALSLQNEQLPSFLKLQLSQAAADLQFSKIRNNLTQKQFEHEIEKMVETQTRRSGLQIDNDVKQQTKQALIDTAYKNAKSFNILGVDVGSAWSVMNKGYQNFLSRIFN